MLHLHASEDLRLDAQLAEPGLVRGAIPNMEPSIHRCIGPHLEDVPIGVPGELNHHRPAAGRIRMIGVTDPLHQDPLNSVSRDLDWCEIEDVEHLNWRQPSSAIRQAHEVVVPTKLGAQLVDATFVTGKVCDLCSNPVPSVESNVKSGVATLPSG
jgi:hypothetical protein